MEMQRFSMRIDPIGLRQWRDSAIMMSTANVVAFSFAALLVNNYRVCRRAVLLFVIVFGAASSGQAEADLVLDLDNVYTIPAGGQVTLRGSFSTPDTLALAYDREFLFGLASTSPHLGIVAGSVLSSTNFSPPLGGAF